MKSIKWNFLIGLIAVTFSFAACGGNNADKKTAEVEETEEDYEEEEESDTLSYEDMDELEEETERDFQNINAIDIEESEVDSMVLEVFRELYPDATDANWAQDANEYIVAFIENDYSIKATFEEDGEWLQSVTEIDFEDLPTEAQALINSKYAPEQFEHIIKVEIPEEVAYNVTFEAKKQTFILTFDEKGKLADKEIEDN